MRAGAMGGFLVLLWPGSSGGGSEPLEEGWGGLLLRSGAVLGVTVICKMSPDQLQCRALRSMRDHQ